MIIGRESEGGPPGEEFDEAGNLINREKNPNEFAEGELGGVKTEKGQRQIHKDAEGRIDLEREYIYDSESDLEDGNYKGYEKRYQFSEDGLKKNELGKSFNRINEWAINHNLDDEGNTTDRQGEVTRGENIGHKWSEVYSQREGVIVMDGKEYEVTLYMEDGEILDQGKNPNKQETGHVWKKWTAVDKKSGDVITHWGQKEKPHGEWGSPPEIIR